jgi:hypothetical protein
VGAGGGRRRVVARVRTQPDGTFAAVARLRGAAMLRLEAEAGGHAVAGADVRVGA